MHKQVHKIESIGTMSDQINLQIVDASYPIIRSMLKGKAHMKISCQ